jgi:hypothetical protein
VSEPVLFYTDQHYPSAVTQGLRQLGIDVLTAQEAGCCGLQEASTLFLLAYSQHGFPSRKLYLCCPVLDDHLRTNWCPAFDSIILKDKNH